MWESHGRFQGSKSMWIQDRPWASTCTTRRVAISKSGTPAHQPNSPECRRFSHSRKSHRGDQDRLAGAPGFEPGNGGIKIWPIPAFQSTNILTNQQFTTRFQPIGWRACQMTEGPLASGRRRPRRCRSILPANAAPDRCLMTTSSLVAAWDASSCGPFITPGPRQR